MIPRILTVGSLFSGIGGLDLGLERAGMQVKWQVENDAYCQRVLAKHWPDVERYGDVRECGENLERVDLICGGFPCQPVSCAGQRKGDTDDRWLWPEFRRVIRVLRPRWVLAENVPGLLSIDAGRLFGGILRDLAESGYDAEWDCIPAAAVGAPHVRDRVFIVGTNTTGATCNADSKRQPGGKNGANRIVSMPTAFRSEVAHAARVFGDGRDDYARIRPRTQSVSEPENGGGAKDVADGSLQSGDTSDGQGKRQGRFAIGRCDSVNGSSWSTEPDVGRVANGVPTRVDRLRGLGNAVVPQVAEWVGRRIVEADDRNG